MASTRPTALQTLASHSKERLRRGEEASSYLEREGHTQPDQPRLLLLVTRSAQATVSEASLTDQFVRRRWRFRNIHRTDVRRAPGGQQGGARLADNGDTARQRLELGRLAHAKARDGALVSRKVRTSPPQRLACCFP